MNSTSKPQKYVAVSTDTEDGQRPLSQARRPRSFKPTPTKVPTLLTFASLLMLCIVLIEIVFHESATAVPATPANQTIARASRKPVLAGVSNSTRSSTTSFSVSPNDLSTSSISSGLFGSSLWSPTTTAADSPQATSESYSAIAYTVIYVTLTVTSGDSIPSLSQSQSTGQTTHTADWTETTTAIIITTEAYLGLTSPSSGKALTSYSEIATVTTTVVATILEENGTERSVIPPSTIPQGPTSHTADWTETLTVTIVTTGAFLALTSPSSSTRPSTTIIEGGVPTITLTQPAALLTLTSPALSTSENVRTSITVSGGASTASDSEAMSTLTSSASSSTTQAAVPVVTVSRSDSTMTNPNAFLTLSSSTSIAGINSATTSENRGDNTYDVAVSTTSAAGLLTLTSPTSAAPILSPVKSVNTLEPENDSATPIVTTVVTEGPQTTVTMLLSDSDALLDLSTSTAILFATTTEHTTLVATTDQNGRTTVVPIVIIATSVLPVTPTMTQSMLTSTSQYTTLVVSTDGNGTPTLVPSAVTVSTVLTTEVPVDVQSQWTVTTQYTTVVSSTDAAGYITSVSSVVVVPTVLTTKPSATSLSLWTVTTSYTTMLITTDQYGHTTTIPAAVVEPMVLNTSPAQSSQSLWTITTQYTTLIGTTDASGHTTSSSVVIEFPTVVTESPTPTSSAQTSQTLWTVTTSLTAMLVTTDQYGHSTTMSFVLVEPTVLTTSPGPDTSATASPGSQDASSTSSITAVPWPIATLTASDMIVTKPFTPVSYFAALYLAPFLAVMIKIFWETIFSAFKMMEPFERLRRHDGVPAKRSLFVQYLSNSISIDVFKSSFERPLSFLTMIVFLFTIVLTSLTATSMTVRARQNCLLPNGHYQRCDPVWIINADILRSVEALLAVCLAVTLIVMILSWNSKINIASDPSSIATIASIFNHERLLQDFRHANPLCDDAGLVAMFRNRHCKLDYHEGLTGKYQYGITRNLTMESVEAPLHEQKRKPLRQWLGGYSEVSNPTVPSYDSTQNRLSNSTQNHLLDAVQLVTTAGFLGIVFAYFLDTHADPFNNFFNSGLFWTRFVYVAVASIVDIQWKRLEREVRITEPYRRMAQGFARPETTILLSLNGTCWSSLPTSIHYMLKGHFKHMWYQTLVSLVAVLSDLNIIAVSGLVYNEWSTKVVQNVSGYFSTVTTALMFIVMLITIAWWRRTDVVKNMPRSPETIGAIFSYLCASRLAQELGSAQLENISTEERNDMLLATGWRLWFGKKRGSDGVERWCIDIEDDGSHKKADDYYGQPIPVGPSDAGTTEYYGQPIPVETEVSEPTGRREFYGQPIPVDTHRARPDSPEVPLILAADISMERPRMYQNEIGSDDALRSRYRNSSRENFF